MSEHAEQRGRRLPASKFAAPRVVSRLVHRDRLLTKLDEGEHRRLTLVVGSPGAGKTTLLADWLAARPDRPSAWLSCDPADTDPVRFVTGIIDAVRAGYEDPGLCDDARTLMTSEADVSGDVMAALADDLEWSGASRILVIDDFQLTGAAGVDALTWLLQYEPSSFQLVVATRVDPPLRLPRMRANEELVELRDADLSFDVEETRNLLDGFDVRLADRELTFVHERSEGWAAGLQMAAISIHASPDARDAADRFELRGHTVAGYFLDEVLYRQPEDVVDFMLATSILDELSVPFCTAVWGDGSAAMLESLYSAHLFLTAIDEETRTYRYHQLIKEVLQAELHVRDPDRETRLHRAAAQYLVSVGRVASAARHLLQAGDPADAFAQLTEGVVRDVLTNPTIGSALDLDDVRPEAFAGAPEILLPLAAELLWRGAFERGSRAVQLVRRTDIDFDAHPELAVRFALVNCLHCTFIGQFDEAMGYREWARPFEAVAAGVADWVVTLDSLAMYCSAYIGEYDRARRLARAFVAAGESEPLTKVLCPGVLSQAAFLEGSLQEAAAFAAETLAAARRIGFDQHYFAFHALRTRALLALERCDLDAAAEVVERSLAIVSGARPAFNYMAQLDRARIWAASGELDDALASLPAARDALKSGRYHSMLLPWSDELEARIRLALGDLAGAERIAEKLPRDRWMVVEAIIALAEGDADRAARALADAPANASVRIEVELRLLRAAIAVTARGSLSSGHAGDPRRAVRDALAIVERHGYVQTVLETAPQVVDHLIAEADQYSSSSSTVRALVAAGIRARQRAARPVRQSVLVDPLTEAEMRVLEKLPERLSYVDMAAELYLSLNTVKTHLRHIYTKLGVGSRSSAVKRATSLGLL